MRLTSAQVVARIFTVSTDIGWEEGHFHNMWNLWGVISGSRGGRFKNLPNFLKMAAPHPSQVINYQPPSTISSGNFSVNSKNILMILTSELSVFPRSHEKQ